LRFLCVRMGILLKPMARRRLEFQGKNPYQSGFRRLKKWLKHKNLS